MADPAATSGATPDPAATAGADTTATAPNGAATPDDAEIGEAGKRALDAMRRENRAALKRAEAAEAKIKEAEDAERSELERATATISERDARIAELEHEADARAAATAHGVPDAWERLRGATPEELDADAKLFAAQYAAQNAGRPAADLGSGARPTTPATGSMGMTERIRRQAGRQ